MNSRALRRLAADHTSLRTDQLPPNYLFNPDADHNDNLTELDILLAGPTHTPFSKGVFKLHLAIPNTYPQQPPTAFFRTPIFHPNVDPQTGGVCVETLKRDWDANLTLRDILVVISCLLLQPNPDSALNAEAGALIQEDYDSFCRRAELMTSIHATIPRVWVTQVHEAQSRGGEANHNVPEPDLEATSRTIASRRRVPAPRQRRAAVSKRSDLSPSAAISRRRLQTGSARPFAQLTRDDDVFGAVTDAETSETDRMEVEDEIHGDETTQSHNQENDDVESSPPPHAPLSRAFVVRRPEGTPVPLGELTLEETFDHGNGNLSDSSVMEAEYPPSPRKSPSKSSPSKPSKVQTQTHLKPENSRLAASHARNITPINAFDRPLALDSPYADPHEETPSPRKKHVSRALIFNNDTPQVRGPVFELSTGDSRLGNTPTRRKHFPTLPVTTPSLPDITQSVLSVSFDQSDLVQANPHDVNMQLWHLCGGDVRRWNLGDFDGDPYPKKAGRW